MHFYSFIQCHHLQLDIKIFKVPKGVHCVKLYGGYKTLLT